MPEAIVVYILVVFMSCRCNCVMYVCQVSLLQWLKIDCCCLQTCSVDVVLLVMCCMCILTFIVTSANISQLWVYLCYMY